MGCVIRADPNKFNRNDVTCTILDQIDCPVPFSENEELVSVILGIEHSNADGQLKVSSLFLYLHGYYL